MRKDIYCQFLQYLQAEFAISELSIETAARSIGDDLDLLPIALWQHHALSVAQLEEVYDWLAVLLRKDSQSDLSLPGFDDDSAMAG